MTPRRLIPTLLLAIPVITLTVPSPARAEVIRPGDVFTATFDLRGVALPNEAEPPDVFGVSVLASRIEPFGSQTVKLFDGDRLLGSFTSTIDGEGSGGFNVFLNAYFAAPTSLMSSVNPTIIDFGSLLDGTIDGRIEFSIAQGLVNVPHNHVELFLGRAVSSREAIGARVFPHGQSATPEPASLLLLATGAAGAFGRRMQKFSLFRHLAFGIRH